MSINSKLLAWYRSRSHRIIGDEPYGNTYVFIVLLTLDLAVAALVRREYGITISSYTGLELRKEQPKAWAIWLGAFLVLCQTNHCEEAIAADRERAQYAQKVLT